MRILVLCCAGKVTLQAHHHLTHYPGEGGLVGGLGEGVPSPINPEIKVQLDGIESFNFYLYIHLEFYWLVINYMDVLRPSN